MKNDSRYPRCKYARLFTIHKYYSGPPCTAYRKMGYPKEVCENQKIFKELGFKPPKREKEDEDGGKDCWSSEKKRMESRYSRPRQPGVGLPLELMMS